MLACAKLLEKVRTTEENTHGLICVCYAFSNNDRW